MPLWRINDPILHTIAACKLMVVYNEDGFSNEKHVYNIFILSLLLTCAIAKIIVSNVGLNTK